MNIDVVYTWVSHLDPHWQELYQDALNDSTLVGDYCASVSDFARFSNKNELFYSISSLNKYAEWVRTIYVVTNCRVPESISNIDKVVVVKHEEIFPDPTVLPVFNSHAIEANLHHIPGLSDKFLYFNDDVFLCKKVEVSDFFDSNNRTFFFPSRHEFVVDECEFKPIDYAIKNVRRILVKDFGYEPMFKLHHSVFVLRKDVLYEMECRYRDYFSITSSNKFRSKDDISIATTFYAYYSYCQGNGVPRKIKSQYVDISSPYFYLLIALILLKVKGGYLTICLNEVNSINRFVRFRDFVLKRFMRVMFS